MKKMTTFLISSLAFLVFVSFVSPKKHIFLEKKKKKNSSVFSSFVYINSGTYKSNEEKEVSVKGFYMKEAEVTNAEYNKFLKDLKKSGEKEKLKIAQIQSSNWNDKKRNNKSFENTYHNHEAFNDYPVLNISHEAAKLYCEWLTTKWNEKNKDAELIFRLPSKTEWMYAASAGRDYSPFPWGGYYIRNAKGCFLANFRRVEESRVKFNRETNAYEIVESKMLSKERLNDNGNISITAPVKTFFPNDYGLYNMSGNVSEFLLDGSTKGGSWGSSAYYLRIQAEEEFKNLNGKASKYVGFRPMVEIKGNYVPQAK